MIPHAQRLKYEAADLTEKCDKLDQFLNTQTYSQLPLAERILMKIQRDQMQLYLNCITTRIFIGETTTTAADQQIQWVTIQFKNKDLDNAVTTIRVASNNAYDVVKHYAAYHAGETFEVQFDGVPQPLTRDGHIYESRPAENTTLKH